MRKRRDQFSVKNFTHSSPNYELHVEDARGIIRGTTQGKGCAKMKRIHYFAIIHHAKQAEKLRVHTQFLILGDRINAEKK